MNPLKDIDSVAGVQYLRVFIWLLVVSLFVGGLLSFMVGLKALFIAVLLSFILPFPILFLLDRMGGTASLLYGGRKANWSLREQLEGDMIKVKDLKMKNNFPAALDAVDAILNQDPEHPEALYMKAKILWEGYDNYPGAKACLKKVVDTKSAKDEPIRRWAISLSEEITLAMKQRSEEE